VRGIEEQIEACKHALALGARVKLWLVGNGEPEYFRTLARGIGIAEYVQIGDAVEPSILSSILERADAAVWNGITVGMPSKIFDYIAHGVPILSRKEESDVNAMCAQFVTSYGSSPAELGRKFFDLWLREAQERTLKTRRTAAGKVFILELHRQSERELLGVFADIAQKIASRSQTSREA
jgi:glycosyltransferase involved in cell wall biosynthesis